MKNRVIQVPVSLLHHPNQTAHTKLVWMGLRLEPDAGPAKLEVVTGLSRHTVLTGLARLAASQLPHGGPRVKMPAALLAERGVGPRAKMLYGLLQTLPSFRWTHGKFSYADIIIQTNISENTLRRAMNELVDSGWVSLRRKNRLSLITFTLGTPEQRRSEAEAARARKRIDRARHKGEAIMHEYLSLLIDDTDYANNSRPSFLVNPDTQELMELDRYYGTLKVAFEFHGDQHDRASGRYTQKQVDDQHRRDLFKAGLCTYGDIHLIIVRAEDLSLQQMIRKIDRFVPLRKVAGHEQLIDVLEDASMCYLAETQAARRSGL